VTVEQTPPDDTSRVLDAWREARRAERQQADAAAGLVRYWRKVAESRHAEVEKLAVRLDVIQAEMRDAARLAERHEEDARRAASRCEELAAELADVKERQQAAAMVRSAAVAAVQKETLLRRETVKAFAACVKKLKASRASWKAQEAMLRWANEELRAALVSQKADFNATALAVLVGGLFLMALLAVLS
jgi:chromosome segregation ATPase